MNGGGTTRSAFRSSNIAGIKRPSLRSPGPEWRRPLTARRRDRKRRGALMMMKATLVALALMGMCGTGLAEENPHPLRQDARIRTVAFQRDNVVVVDGALGVSTMIMFG